MKREYLKPAMSVVELQHSGIICTSKVENLGGNGELILGGDDAGYIDGGGYIR
jgi:hypothetical protein